MIPFNFINDRINVEKFDGLVDRIVMTNGGIPIERVQEDDVKRKSQDAVPLQSA